MSKRRSINNLELGMIIGLALLFFIPFAILVPRQVAFEMLDAICISLAIGGSSSYLRECWHALKMPIHKMLSAHYIVAGVFFSAMGLGLIFAGQWVWRINNKPDWIIDSVPILFSRFLAVIGLGLFMLTSYSRGGVVEVGAYSRPTLVTATAFIGVLAAWRWFG